MPDSIHREVERIFAIGDLHGNYQGLWDILSHLEIIDSGGHWQAGNAHLVQLGDILGRGGEPGRIYALLHRLEKEAEEQGGAVHLLLGNHEILTLRGTLLYNTPEEFQDIADWAPAAFGPISEAHSKAESQTNPKYRERLAMLGCSAFQRYLSPEGPIGEWLMHHPTAVILGDSLFVHGGLNRAHGLIPLDALNHQVWQEIARLSEEEPKDNYPAKHLSKDGPQWNREFTTSWSTSRHDELLDVLGFQGCARMVVGHTPTGTIAPLRTGEVLPLYEERLWCADTGIGAAYGGHLSALSIAENKISPVYP